MNDINLSLCTLNNPNAYPPSLHFFCSPFTNTVILLLEIFLSREKERFNGLRIMLRVAF